MEKFHPEKFFPFKKEGEKENIEEREKVISTEAGKEISEEKADKGVSKKIKIKKITRKIVRIEEIKKEKIETKENLEKKAELIISEYFLREKESQNWEEFLPVHEKMKNITMKLVGLKWKLSLVFILKHKENYKKNFFIWKNGKDKKK